MSWLRRLWSVQGQEILKDFWKRERREVGTAMRRSEFKDVFLPQRVYPYIYIRVYSLGRDRFLGASLLLSCQGCSYHCHLNRCMYTQLPGSHSAIILFFAVRNTHFFSIHFHTSSVMLHLPWFARYNYLLSIILKTWDTLTPTCTVSTATEILSLNPWQFHYTWLCGVWINTVFPTQQIKDKEH